MSAYGLEKYHYVCIHDCLNECVREKIRVEKQKKKKEEEQEEKRKDAGSECVERGRWFQTTVV